MTSVSCFFAYCKARHRTCRAPYEGHTFPVARIASPAPRSFLKIIRSFYPVKEPYYEESSLSDQESGSTWARLIAQVYEVDPLTCSRCGSPMRILAVITEPEEVKKILRHLVKVGRPPPGLDPNFVYSLLCLPACSGGRACLRRVPRPSKEPCFSF